MHPVCKTWSSKNPINHCDNWQYFNMDFILNNSILSVLKFLMNPIRCRGAGLWCLQITSNRWANNNNDIIRCQCVCVCVFVLRRKQICQNININKWQIYTSTILEKKWKDKNSYFTFVKTYFISYFLNSG